MDRTILLTTPNPNPIVKISPLTLGMVKTSQKKRKIKILSFKQAKEIAGSLSKTTKMSCMSYGLSASKCKTGGKLKEIKNSVCRNCYCDNNRGNYRHKTVKDAQEKRFESLTHPLWVDAMVAQIFAYGQNKFRWHDSGDIQSLEHLENIVQIALHFEKGENRVDFWLPTKEYGLIACYVLKYGNKWPRNLNVRISAPLVGVKFSEARAKALGCTTSSVTKLKSKKEVRTEVGACPAYSQDNMCGSCRACWSSKVFNVDYPKH